MSVVEITQLRLKGLTVDDPTLLESLSLVRGKLQTNSRFFSCIEDPSLIYIFGVWPSLDAHLKFLASPARNEILGPQEDILDFQWTAHLKLNAISPRLLDVPFIAIEKVEVNGDQVGAWNQDIDEHARHLQMIDQLDVIHGWRCDAPIGNHEAITLTRMLSLDPDVAIAGRHATLHPQGNNTGAYRCILFHRARNIEQMDSGHKTVRS
jgi:hypothetical protein